MFSFRNDPSFWFLDDVSVSNSSGKQFLSNGGFEQGTLTNWVYCNPSNATFAGVVTSSVHHSGTYCYSDGSVGSPDYLSQAFNVQPNTMYSVQFWLSATGTNNTLVWVTLFS